MANLYKAMMWPIKEKDVRQLLIKWPNLIHYSRLQVHAVATVLLFTSSPLDFTRKYGKFLDTRGKKYKTKAVTVSVTKYVKRKIMSSGKPHLMTNFRTLYLEWSKNYACSKLICSAKLQCLKEEDTNLNFDQTLKQLSICSIYMLHDFISILYALVYINCLNQYKNNKKMMSSKCTLMR